MTHAQPARSSSHRSTRTRSTRAVAGCAVLALVGLGALTGCGSDDSTDASASSSAAATTQSSASAGSSSSTLPADFPTDTVPLLDGDVTASSTTGSGSSESFDVTVSGTGTAKHAAAAAVKRLETAGWEVGTKLPGGTGYLLMGGDGQVDVAAQTDGSSTTVTYQVFTS
ncbi:hypothetical protein [Nocardioides bruguierae]|uniref:Uncharacterized protein n=1 Tax=Nocardioides bruguierae TaxID=2945102 RepID=A0A9X2D9I0_9ACTN|nr:hypothetical protein [Nocardioides bruguierae]MCM0620564.1 hypothetical protein [Nocardioides bruguierae]